MIAFADRVKELGTVSGTGNYYFAGPYSGMRGFLSTLGSGATCQIAVEGSTAQWEVCEGTINQAGYITRNRIISSSNNGNIVAWPSGSTVTIYLTVSSDLLTNIVRTGKMITTVGTLQIKAGTVRWYPPNNCTLTSWDAWVGTAPSGGYVRFALRKNGSIVATGTINDSLYRMGATAISVPLTMTDYVTLDITTVGSAIAGSDLVVRLTV